jgi:signal transduction histidine kinase
VTVTDDGGGIDPSVLPQIFEPFFTTKPPESGTGLGLAISREIVLEAGGDVRVVSSTAEGTTFQVVLPMNAGAVNGASITG